MGLRKKMVTDIDKILKVPVQNVPSSLKAARFIAL